MPCRRKAAATPSPAKPAPTRAIFWLNTLERRSSPPKVSALGGGRDRASRAHSAEKRARAAEKRARAAKKRARTKKERARTQERWGDAGNDKSPGAPPGLALWKSGETATGRRGRRRRGWRSRRGA